MSFRKSIITTLGLNIYTFIIGFINSIISTRILGAEGKGIFAIYSSSIELFALVLGLGIPQALIFFAAKDEIDRGRLFYSSLLYITISSVVFLGIVLASSWAGLQSFFLPEPFTGSFYVAMIIANFFGLSGWYFFVSILNGHKYFQQTNLISFLNISLIFFIYLLLLIIPSDKIGYQANTFYVIQLISSLFTLVVTLYFLKRLLGKFTGALVSRVEASSIIRYGAVYYVSNFMFFANTKMDYWFINYFRGSHDLGIYVLSSNVALLMLMFPNAVGLVLSAFKAKSDIDDMESRTAFLCRLTTMITVSISIFLWVVAEPVIVLLYGDEFRESAYILRIILFGVIPFSIFTILKSYFAGANKLRDFLIASCVGFVFTVILDLTLIKPYGITGAALATVVAYLASAFYLIFVFSRKTGIRVVNIIVFNWHDYLYTKELVFNFIKRRNT